MSKFYVIGSDNELKSKNQDFLLDECDITMFKKFNKTAFTNKYHYVIKTNNNQIGYDIKNYNEFNTDQNKIKFDKFLLFIDEFLQTNDTISFYVLWESNKIKCEENKIINNSELTTNTFNYPEDFFQFEFNTRYIFSKKKENNIEI